MFATDISFYICDLPLYLQATDRDSGANSALTYRILSGNENNEFTINSSNGQLSMKTMLDAEKISLFVLIVSVVDRHGKSNALEDLAAVQINVHVRFYLILFRECLIGINSENGRLGRLGICV